MCAYYALVYTQQADNVPKGPTTLYEVLQALLEARKIRGSSSKKKNLISKDKDKKQS